jgi:hypothetical protein
VLDDIGGRGEGRDGGERKVRSDGESGEGGDSRGAADLRIRAAALATHKCYGVQLSVEDLGLPSCS